MYAIVKTGGKQYKVAEGDVLFVEKLEANAGDVVTFDEVLACTKNGELVVVTAGALAGVSGTTNLIQVHVISRELANGVGVGSKTAEGKVCVIRDSEDCNGFNEGDIIVTTMTDIEMNPYIEKASAIITQEGGMTSHAAIVGLNLNIPVIVSANNIMDVVKNGDIVTVDAARGVVYEGLTRVL